jgi:hypothetical protein
LGGAEALPTCTALFWIDTICINQTDMKEKSEQVPRMGKIYGSAEQVLAWLGPSGSGEDAMIREVFAKANELDHLYQHPEIGRAAFPIFSSYLAEEDGTTNFKAFCETIVNVIRRPWFSPVWVLQEAVLARDPAILLLGRAATTVYNLYLLWAALRMFVKDGLIRQDLIAGIQIAHFESTRLDVQSEQLQTSGGQPNLPAFAKQLYQLLDTATSGLKSTLPQDMIYGLLGMTNVPRLPVSLQPNYEKPCSEVFHNYSRFLIESTRSLTLLPTRKNGLAGVPNWAPDFREQRFGITGIKAESPTLASVAFSSDNTLMTLEGIELSTCVSSFQAPRVCIDDIEALIGSLPRFEKDIIKQACRIANSVFDDTLRRWLDFLIESSHYNAFGSVVDDFYKLYSLLVDREQPDSKMSGADFLALAKLLQQSLAGLSHFVATDGSIGMLMREDTRALQGDRVCIFRGSIYASLIRPCGENYIFLGGCRLNNRIGAEGYNEDFFVQHLQKLFTLI